MSRRSAAIRRGLPPAAMGVSATADRRFRRPDVRPAGVRSLRRLSRRAIGIGVLAVILVAVVAYATQAVLTSSLLRVRQITVHGTSRLKADDVAALVSGLRQDNILLADLPRYRQRLLGSTWIENVTLRRQLPSAVAIEVTERVPMIVAHVGDRLYLVDRSGAIIDEDGPQYRDFDLPLVDGLVPAGGVVHGSVDAWHVALVERFLRRSTPRRTFGAASRKSTCRSARRGGAARARSDVRAARRGALRRSPAPVPVARARAPGTAVGARLRGRPIRQPLRHAAWTRQRGEAGTDAVTVRGCP